MPEPKAISTGIIAAAITPRRAREQSIDLASALELIDFLDDKGLQGIALLGSTGEFAHFALEDRARMLDFAVKRSRLPVMVNVSHSTLDGTVWLGQEAAGSGVAAVLVMPPHYFRYSQAAVRAFCLQAGEELAKEVPVYLYNIPLFTTALAPETALDLLATGLFAGIKDSSGDWDTMEMLLGARQERALQVFAGDDRLYPYARDAGGDGAVSGVASTIPELLVRLDRAILDTDRALAERLWSRLNEFLDRIHQFPIPVGIREAAKVRKLKAGANAAPLGPEGERELDAFRGWFKEWLAGVLRECR